MRFLSLLAPPLCVHCRAPAGHGNALCAACRRALRHLGPQPVILGGLEAWAAVAYEGPARAVVRRLKFAGAVALADHMAAVIAANAPPAALRGALVPVPTPSARRRLRGFCHAELIATALARRTGTPALPLLARAGGSGRQVGRARTERLHAPPRFRALARGREAVTLVDDVVTTGATLTACAGALRAGGWRCEAAVAYARTPVR